MFLFTMQDLQILVISINQKESEVRIQESEYLTLSSQRFQFPEIFLSPRLKSGALNHDSSTPTH